MICALSVSFISSALATASLTAATCSSLAAFSIAVTEPVATPLPDSSTNLASFDTSTAAIPLSVGVTISTGLTSYA